MNTTPSPLGAAQTAAASPFGDQWWQDPGALHVNGVTVSVRAPGTAVGATPGTAPERPFLVHVNASETGTVDIRLDVPLGDAAGFWHPDAGWERTLPADWSAWRPLSLVRSAPVGCLYDTAGRNLLAFATDHVVQRSLIRFGVSEERKRFGVWLRLLLAADESCLIRLATPGITFAAALRELRDWLTELPVVRPLPVPDFARTPVYSTWYAFTQDVNAADVEAEAALASDLGCGQLFLDDGWQLHGSGRGYAGCGDWRPDPAKFPDLPGHVEKVHGLGLRHVVWIAPLLLGSRSDAYRAWAARAPHYVPHLDCHVLDPRHRDVRDHVVATCRGLVEENGLDGLKLDFLDEVMAYTDAPPAVTPEPDYIPDIGHAMTALLTDLRDSLRSLRGDEVVLELRQPYTGPAMTTFGNALRATDCPADPVANRVRTLDIGMVAPGAVVHSDMLMWDPQAAPETVARQLHGALHAVPQLSIRLSRLSLAHRETLAFWLGTWYRLRAALIGGTYETGRPDELYPHVTAHCATETVITAYADTVLRLPQAPWQALTLVNATPAARLLVETPEPAEPVLVRVHTYGADGRPQPPTTRLFTGGVHTLDVPPSGLCRLTTDRAAAGHADMPDEA
ncbi:glycoside hydrolase family 36 protein [Streptomyces sp. NPDC052042]|uniref:glycoside hydrolase family 36 protein n=1 Tax=Streptomyces sp. NPDC052042 TaxID=3365683 RepID=UPI0037D2657D